MIFRLQGHDEKEINRNLNRIVNILSKAPGESQPAAMARTRQLGSFFSSDAAFHLSPHFPNPENRAELTSYVFQARAQTDALDINIYDRQLEIYPDGDSATMLFTARANIIHSGNQRERLVHEFELGWAREDGDWLISEVKLIEGIRHPGLSE